VRVLFFITLTVLFSLEAYATTNEIKGKVMSIQGGENGLYFTLDSGLPETCKSASSQWLLIPQSNVASMVIITSNLASRITVYAQHDSKTLDCKVTSLKYRPIAF
jgi:hypothetical protein